MNTEFTAFVTSTPTVKGGVSLPVTMASKRRELYSHSTFTSTSNPRGMSDWATAGQSVVSYFMRHFPKLGRVRKGPALFRLCTDDHSL